MSPRVLFWGPCFRCCFYHIRDLRRIHRFISLPVAKTIAKTVVRSRLDYCNSLLYNTANKDIEKLQRVQNSKGSHAFSFFSLSAASKNHYIDILHYRIIFKICTIAFQALSSTQPAYSMLTPATNSRLKLVVTLITILG